MPNCLIKNLLEEESLPQIRIYSKYVNLISGQEEEMENSL